MSIPGTTFPGALDPPLDVTLADDTIDPDHVNSVDDRVRAVEAKVGADGSAVTSSHDWKLRPSFRDQRTTAEPTVNPAPTEVIRRLSPFLRRFSSRAVYMPRGMVAAVVLP